MAQPGSLSDEDVEHLRDELVRGREPTVWFTADAVGVEAGKSARVVGINDPVEGDYIQVRPAGSHDELSFSPSELTLARPGRKRSPAELTAVSRPSMEQTMSEIENTTTEAPEEVAAGDTAVVEEETTPAAKKPRPAASTAKKTRVADVVITISGSVDGDWTVDVVAAKKKALRALPVTPAVVGQAAKALHPDVAESIEAILEQAREQQTAKVEQLRAELEAAQKALEELAG
jgi:DNA-binding transcriptional regulator YdaS (Cro superfamily)